MRTEVRIVAGTLRTRKIVCESTAQLRPTPHRVREALFNIWADFIPDRPFFDLFAGTGVNGFEALSRGASYVTFIERDGRLTRDIARHIALFDAKEKAVATKSNVYRWANEWEAPSEPVNVFVSPPFADLDARTDAFVLLLDVIKSKIAESSMIVVQSEDIATWGDRIDMSEWEERRYGRNILLFWPTSPKATSP